jgi:hypothetical protein
LLPTNGCNHPETKTHRIKQQLPANNHHLKTFVADNKQRQKQKPILPLEQTSTTKTVARATNHHQNSCCRSNEPPPKSSPEQ